MSSSTEFTNYSRYGICIDIPSHLKVKMEDSSGFFAASKDERSTIAIEINPVDANWEASEMMIRQPLGVNPMLKSVILREGPIEKPYSGYERIVEHFMKTTGETDFGWLVNCVSSTTRIILEVGDFCTFAEGEEMWTKVVQSLRIKDA